MMKKIVGTAGRKCARESVHARADDHLAIFSRVIFFKPAEFVRGSLSFSLNSIKREASMFVSFVEIIKPEYSILYVCLELFEFSGILTIA